MTTMWQATLTSEDFLTYWLGDPTALESRLKQCPGISLNPKSSKGVVEIYWNEYPLSSIYHPILIVSSENDSFSFLQKFNALPSGINPVTSLTRIMTPQEVSSYSKVVNSGINNSVTHLIVAISFVEAICHSNLALNLKQLTIPDLKRTLSFVWAKGLFNQIPDITLNQIPVRWEHTQMLIHNHSEDSKTELRVIPACINILKTCETILNSKGPKYSYENLAYALINKDKNATNIEWIRILKTIDIDLELASFHKLPREERSNILLKYLSHGTKDEPIDYFIGAAFIATQVSPGTMEQLENLFRHCPVDVVFWYALFSAILYPKDILSFNNGLGLRLLRDIESSESYFESPKADISYNELATIRNIDLSYVSNSFGHRNEVLVELVPLITSSFTLSKRSISKVHSKSIDNHKDDENFKSIAERAFREDLKKAVNQLYRIIKSMPD